MKYFTTLAMISAMYCLPGCTALVQPALQSAGVGVTSEDDIVAATSKQFGLDKSQIKISDVRRQNLPSGQEMYYNAIMNGKAYRCYLKTNLLGHAPPVCAKPGDPLNIPQ